MQGKKAPAAERFWGKVSPEPNSGCWLWDGAWSGVRYGIFWDGKKLVGAHVFSYLLDGGGIPKGWQLDHLCRVTCCVNPAHLQPVPRKINMARAHWPNSAKTHCPKGHPYDYPNTFWNKKGRRECRICKRERSRINDARYRAAVRAQRSAAGFSDPSGEHSGS